MLDPQPIPFDPIFPPSPGLRDLTGTTFPAANLGPDLLFRAWRRHHGRDGDSAARSERRRGGRVLR